MSSFRINTCGIPVLRTIAVTTNTLNSSVVYDLDHREVRELHREGLMLLFIAHKPATGSNNFLVSLSTRRTSSGTGTITTSSFPLLNGNGVQMKSSEVVQGSRLLIYFNKCQGIFQVVNHIVPVTVLSEE